MAYLSISLRLFLAAMLALPFWAATGPSPALACSGDGVPLPEARFARGGIVQPGGIALLGVVQQEFVFEQTLGPQPYLSMVETIVPLAGERIPLTVRVGPHGYSYPDCSGGPRLIPGEKVLLFLHPARPLLGTIGQTPGPFGDWQTGVFGAPILFDDDSAYYLGVGRFSSYSGTEDDQRQYVGRSEDVLRQSLAYFNIAAEDRQRAYEFVLGRVPGPQIAPPNAGDGGLLAVED